MNNEEEILDKMIDNNTVDITSVLIMIKKESNSRMCLFIKYIKKHHHNAIFMAIRM